MHGPAGSFLPVVARRQVPGGAGRQVGEAWVDGVPRQRFGKNGTLQQLPEAAAGSQPRRRPGPGVG